MDDADRPLFPGYVVTWLIIVGLCAVGLSVYFGIVETRVEEHRRSPPAANSALGYGLFEKYLGSKGVSLASAPNGRKTGRPTLVIYPEERVLLSNLAREADPSDADHILLVLPKWEAVGKVRGNGWIRSVRRISQARVQSLLERCASGVTLLKNVVNGRQRFESAAELNDAQVLSPLNLSPVLSLGDGVLVAELPNRRPRTWILSDPDLISNHGIVRAENARLALDVVRRILPENGVVVLADRNPLQRTIVHNPLEMLFAFPFAVIPISFGAFALVLCWAALGRFGSPRSAEPIAVSGNEALVSNAVGLIVTPQQYIEVTRNYARGALLDVAAALRVPRDLTEAEVLHWIGRARKGSQRTADYAALLRRLDESARGADSRAENLVVLAGRVFDWKKEQLDGPIWDSEPGATSQDRSGQSYRRPRRGG